MRSYQQKQILALIQTLKDACDEVKRLHARGDIPAAMRLLSDCHAGATQIACYIGESEGGPTGAAACLDDYCGILREAGGALESGHAADLIKGLKKQLIKTENRVRDELKPNRIEVVFLPYKASMWDSMESVYLSARADERCMAYVVPIPYFDRLPGGAMGQMHDESGEYPDDVPITHWRDYDIAARHPDAIFIHNPYDNVNTITSVHPDYYSKRLKEHTDLLCYIPYFVVLDDVEPPFCTLPGVLYADRVFVQSEKIRDTYIRVFRDFERKNGVAGQFGRTDEKFIAAGSPKFDKVISAQAEDFTLPDEWKKLIGQPGSTQKKIVLYNTSITALLQGNEVYLEKLQYVLDLFAKRDDALLWWRPHPLNEAAYAAMRPQLLDRYRKIAEEYQEAGFGIYDDTADLHRAICLSSGYYGDWSSIMAMYRLTGKPAIAMEDTRAFPATENILKSGGAYWFSAFEFNGLFLLDKNSGKTQFIGAFPHEQPDGRRLFSGCIQAGGNLIFIPYSAGFIAVYDTRARQFHSIPLDQPAPCDGYLPHAKFSFALPYGKHVFLFPGYYPAIVKLNIEDFTIEYITDCLAEVSRRAKSEAGYFSAGYRCGHQAVMLSRQAHSAFSFDMRTHALTALHPTGPYQKTVFDGAHAWSADYEHLSVLKWSFSEGEKARIPLRPDEANRKGAFLHMACLNGYVWVFPERAYPVMRIHAESGRVSDEAAFPYSEDESVWSYSVAKAFDSVLCAYDGYNQQIIEYGGPQAIARLPLDMVQIQIERLCSLMKAERPAADGRVYHPSGPMIYGCLQAPPAGRA